VTRRYKLATQADPRGLKFDQRDRHPIRADELVLNAGPNTPNPPPDRALTHALVSRSSLDTGQPPRGKPRGGFLCLVPGRVIENRMIDQTRFELLRFLQSSGAFPRRRTFGVLESIGEVFQIAI
jgi:hypothetical protein